MNREHLAAFFWLRWRLLFNQFRRSGTANVVVLAILLMGGALLSIGLLIGGLLIGMLALPTVSPKVLMYIFDGLIIAFLFFWAIEILAELQRSEALSLEKFLHLPVSPLGAFVVNYVSSLFSFGLLLFLPPMLGLLFGLVLGRGPAMLLLFPLLLSFVLMVTSLTYQFKGWLASIMVNPRRRRTVIVSVTAAFILLTQLPNLINVFQPWKSKGVDELKTAEMSALAEVDRAQAEQKLAEADATRQRNEIAKKYKDLRLEGKAQKLRSVEETTRFVNTILPPGWLPLGAMALAEGAVLTPLLGTAGFLLLSAGSLWRSYKSTVRLYMGDFTSTRSVEKRVTKVEASTSPSTCLVERSLPGISEHASAIAFGVLRSLLRAPEAKMVLLTPALIVFLFGSMIISRGWTPPEMARPLVATGGLTLILVTLSQLVCNQFGFDRSGFRVFVLCPARRHDVLLGKNLAFAPFALGLEFVLLVVIQVFYPMRFDHFLAQIVQAISIFLLFCFLANWLSIFACMPVAPGTMKPTNPRLIPILLHVAFLFVLPMVISPTLVPLGLELAIAHLTGVAGLPINLGLSLLECVLICVGYRYALVWQGNVLQTREQKILEIVAAKAE